MTFTIFIKDINIETGLSEELMQELFEHVDDELYQLADKSASDVLQTRYFEAMRELPDMHLVIAGDAEGGEARDLARAIGSARRAVGLLPERLDPAPDPGVAS